MPAATHNEEASYAKIHKRNDLHLLRKFWHIATGMIVMVLYYSFPNIAFKNWGHWVGAFGIMGLMMDQFRLRYPPLNRLAVGLFRPFMRREEIKGPSGLPHYALGCALSILLYPENLAILSIYFLIFADPISSAWGVLMGKDKILKNKKSIQGSLACFFTCFIITLIFAHFHQVNHPTLVLFAILAASFGTLAEMASVYVDDNFTIPFISGLGMTLINKVFVLF